MTFYGRAKDHRVIVIVSKGDDIQSGPLINPNTGPQVFRWGRVKPGNPTDIEPGATNLARALLLHVTGSDAQVQKFYQRFKHRTVSEWEYTADFTITAPEIETVLKEIEETVQETAGAVRAASAARQGPVVSEGGPGIKWKGESDEE